jgi:uncharacterized membrane protein
MLCLLVLTVGILALVREWALEYFRPSQGNIGTLVLLIIVVSRAWWYMPVIPATQEVEAGGSLSVQGQPGTTL